MQEPPPDAAAQPPEELGAFQSELERNAVPENPSWNRWVFGSLIACALILLIMGLIGMAKGARANREANARPPGHLPDFSGAMD